MEGLTSGDLVIGRLPPSHVLFQPGNAACQMIQRLGVYDVDKEELCHSVIKTFGCYDPSCGVNFSSVMEYDMHYNSVHRYSCATCRRNFASPHLLDLHVEETHDSFFAVQAERKPMFRCFVESCSSRFLAPDKRHSHCIEEHVFPSNFRWITSKPSKKNPNKNKPKKCAKFTSAGERMEQDNEDVGEKVSEHANVPKRIVLGRGKKKCFESNDFKKSEWHRRKRGDGTSSSKSALEGSELSSDLMDSLPVE